VYPSGAALGADIEGVELARALSPDAVDAIKQAWADQLVCGFAARSPTTIS
jgi:hypothetical protein